MADYATFKGPGGVDPVLAVRKLQISVQPTVGDCLYAGQLFRARILERTAKGVDVSGAPFAPYSTKGPYYFYPNRESGAARGPRATEATQKARKTAAAGRHAKTGREGKRTPYGIRYASYAAAKAAHGRGNVDLFGLEQHTHMLNTMLVVAGGTQLDMTFEQLSGAGEMEAFEQGTPCTELKVGFYGPEAARAKGNNEGTGKIPARKFFALSPEDLNLARHGIIARMVTRAKAGRQA